ncbi:MAG: RHS repeat-associated core domain-containing protein [Phycisphaerae bacterium]
MDGWLERTPATMRPQWRVRRLGDAAPTAEYFGALGRQLINATGGPVYDGHDQVGSAVLTTDAQSGSNNGARMSRRYFTAFGERVAELGESGQPPPSWAATTFGYCGAWGYEGSAEWPTESNFGSPSSNDDFWESDLGVLHVGARWYWPETGRFLERDPIGIRGGANVYQYSSNCPTNRIDPKGLESIIGEIIEAVKLAERAQGIYDDVHNAFLGEWEEIVKDHLESWIVEQLNHALNGVGVCFTVARWAAEAGIAISDAVNEAQQDSMTAPGPAHITRPTDVLTDSRAGTWLDRAGKTSAWGAGHAMLGG